MRWSIDEPGGRPAARRLPTACSIGALAVGALTLGACAFDFGGVVYDESGSTSPASSGSTSTGPGGDGGATSASTGSAAGGGGGGPVACGDVECPTVECYATSCEGTSCLLAPLEAGTPCGPEGAQTCTASQDCVACAEEEDCGPSLSSCRTVACIEGACVESALAERAPCLGEEGVCTAAQACVECVDELECDDEQVCVDGACTTPAATCFDLTQNAGETAVDCGGPCPPCANGLTCAGADDCQSGYCNGVCSACSTPAHCGAAAWCSSGACAPKKGDGVQCQGGTECTSGNCVDQVCCDQPCSGTCMSCRSGATGSSDGTCAPSLVDTDPDDECSDGECLSGACNGQGQCGFVVGQCADLCQVSNGSAYLYTGACYQGECGHFSGYSCGDGFGCNAEMNACEKL